MPSHERLVIGQRLCQHRHSFRRAQVSQGNCDVPEQSTSLQGRALEATGEFLPCERHKLDQLHLVDPLSRPEPFLRGDLHKRTIVEWADLLGDLSAVALGIGGPDLAVSRRRESSISPLLGYVSVSFHSSCVTRPAWHTPEASANAYVRRNVGQGPPANARLTDQTHTGPTICRACVMGAEGFEPRARLVPYPYPAST
jgi:hypothetical protein